MVERLYPIMAGVIAISMMLFLSFNRSVKKKSSTLKIYNNVLFCTIIFTLSEMCWAFCASSLLNVGKTPIAITCFILHFCGLFISYIWFRFGTTFMGRKYSLVYRHILFIPFIFGMILLILTPFAGAIYTIDDTGFCAVGPYRYLLFIVICFYLLHGACHFLVNSVKERNPKERIRNIKTFVALICPVILGSLQSFITFIPLYSLGYFFCTIIIFTTITSDRERDMDVISEQYKNESEEIYKALEALSGIFVSIHLVDMQKRIVHTIHASEFVRNLTDEQGDAGAQFTKVMRGTVKPEYLSSILDFVNLDTLNTRMQGQKQISHEFVGVNEGWCISSFLRLTDDESGNLHKVVHLVQSIDANKRREAAYERKLQVLYKDQNVIYAELLKMQPNGIVVTDMNEEILFINDTARKIYGVKEESETAGNLVDLTKKCTLEDQDAFLIRYDHLKLYGGYQDYFFTAYDEEGNIRRYHGEVKRGELSGKRTVILTTITEITEA